MSDIVTLAELTAALDNLLIDDMPPMLDDMDVTIARMAVHMQCQRLRAKNVINNLVKAGKLVPVGRRREVRGHTVDAWRIA